MFRGLINDAKSAVGSTVAKYAARASVAVPFIIALGFATAGVTLMLVERFGHRNAYFMVAGGFLVLGLLAAQIVRTKEYDEVVADEQASKADTADVASDAAAAAAVQMPRAAGRAVQQPRRTIIGSEPHASPRPPPAACAHAGRDGCSVPARVR